MEFGYWGVKGRAEAIRWLIAYLGLEVKEWNPANPQEWAARKPLLGLFANLPFLTDGAYTVTEAEALPTYLILKAGKPDLLGKEAVGLARVKQIESVLADIIAELFKIMGQGPDYAAALTKVFNPTGAVETKLGQLSLFLGHQAFLLGYLTWADILLAYISRIITAFAVSLGLADPMAKYGNLLVLADRVEGLPGIKERVTATKGLAFLPPSMAKFHVKPQSEW